MFLTEDEARERLNGSRNLLRRGVDNSVVVNSVASHDVSSISHGGDLKGESEPEKEIESDSPVVSGEVKGLHYKQEKHPMNGAMHEVIGTLAHSMHRKPLALAFDISTRHVTGLKTGAPGHGKPNPELRHRIDQNVGKISDVALELTLEMLGLIKTKDNQNLSTKELASTAKDIASVHEKVSSGNRAASGQQMQVIFYSPKEKSESKYDMVEVNPI